jgi:hypothetical protein
LHINRKDKKNLLSVLNGKTNIFSFVPFLEGTSMSYDSFCSRYVKLLLSERDDSSLLKGDKTFSSPKTTSLCFICFRGKLTAGPLLVQGCWIPLLLQLLLFQFSSIIVRCSSSTSKTTNPCRCMIKSPEKSSLKSRNRFENYRRKKLSVGR